jgi:peptidoglycan/xylan/chitin deacetylase (PgdA/CDA1 family)
MMRRKLQQFLRRRADKLMGRSRPVILMYHQIADISIDPWDLAVSRDNFASQLEALTRTRDVVPLTDLGKDRPGGKPLAAITFDDGYRNVATVAKPILERFNCPATVFLTTGAIGSAREFWWDELTRIVLESAYAGILTFKTGRLQLSFDLSNRSQLTKTHGTIWESLRKLEPQERSDILSDLAVQAGVDTTPRNTHAIMSPQDVAGLKDSVITVGAHTVTHPFMPGLDTETVQWEVSQSRKDCEALAGYLPPAFAYPFGSFDSRGADAVRQAGFQYAVTCEHDLVRPDADRVLLPRAAALNWNGETLMRRLP